MAIGPGSSSEPAALKRRCSSPRAAGYGASHVVRDVRTTPRRRWVSKASSIQPSVTFTPSPSTCDQTLSTAGSAAAFRFVQRVCAADAICDNAPLDGRAAELIELASGPMYTRPRRRFCGNPGTFWPWNDRQMATSDGRDAPLGAEVRLNVLIANG